jgi:hypothetical protein
MRTLVAVGAAAAGTALAYAIPRGGFIVLGLGLGLAVLWATAVVRRRSPVPPAAVLAAASLPFVSLGRTARPLVLPLLTVLAVGTVQMSWAIQVLAGTAVVVLAWFAVIHPELRWLAKMLADAERAADSLHVTIGKHLVWLVVLTLSAIPLWREAASTAEFFGMIGGPAAFLLVLGLVLWAAALALRLIGHATSYLRVVFAVVLGLCVVRLAMAGGLIPGDDAVTDAAPGLLAVGAGALLALSVGEAGCAAVLLWAPKSRPGPLLAAVRAVSRKRWGGGSQLRLRSSKNAGRIAPLRAAREYGLTAAVAASLALLAATVIGLLATAGGGRDLNRPGHLARGSVGPAPPRSDRELAAMYAPVLALTGDERWSPVRVDAYVKRAVLDGKPVPGGRPAALPPSCADAVATPCHRLTIKCSTGHQPCAQSDLAARSVGLHSVEIHRPPEGATYVRVLRRARPATDGSPDPFAPWTRGNTGLAGLSTLIQYWYFYYYDEWEAPAFAGLLTQRHESDWEAVTIGLTDARPLFVGYSEHCSGRWVRWPDVEVSSSPGVGGPTHPLVAVARGSHANYPEADQERSPDWTRCAGAPAGLTTLVSYASNIRDKTEYAWLWQQPPAGLRLVDARTPPMSYRGSWGQYDETNLSNFRSIRVGGLGHGPLSPPLQTLWHHPLEKILCNYGGPAHFTPRGCPPGAAGSS